MCFLLSHLSLAIYVVGACKKVLAEAMNTMSCVRDVLIFIVALSALSRSSLCYYLSLLRYPSDNLRQEVLDLFSRYVLLCTGLRGKNGTSEKKVSSAPEKFLGEETKQAWRGEISMPACSVLRQNSVYMAAMIASPNSLHLISVAPSIKRAKSYVTRLFAIAPSIPVMIKSAASVHPM